MMPPVPEGGLYIHMIVLDNAQCIFHTRLVWVGCWRHTTCPVAAFVTFANDARLAREFLDTLFDCKSSLHSGGNPPPLQNVLLIKQSNAFFQFRWKQEECIMFVNVASEDSLGPAEHGMVFISFQTLIGEKEKRSPRLLGLFFKPHPLPSRLPTSLFVLLV